MKVNPHEMFDLVDEAGRVIGSARRSECHGNPALLHPVVHVLVFNRRGDLFLQKRSRSRDVQPGKWDSSVGGHCQPGEKAEDAARREMREELGVDAGELHFLHGYIWRSPIESERVTTFRVLHEGPFILDPDEMDEGRFWPQAEIQAAVGRGVLTPNFEEEFRRLASRG